jgi:acetyl-CoA acyltransferase 2
MGDSRIALAGGSDSMSQAPYAVRGIRFGTKLGVDIKLEDMMWAALTDFHCKTPMGITAENLAEKYKISREDVDAFALRSQMTWKNAKENGHFKGNVFILDILELFLIAISINLKVKSPLLIC